MKRLSVIIVTYHSEHDIYDCLQSIEKYCDIPREELEIIVVDNSQESDDMFARLRQLHNDSLLLIHNTHNGGYGQGNNVGIRQSSSPVVLVMNPDVRLCEPIFKTALMAFENDSQLCIYGMKQMLSEKQNSPLSFDCSRQMNGYLIPFATTLCNKFDIFIPSCMFVAGSCFFVSKEKFEAVGLFDEDLFMYGEEDDIHYRLKKRFSPHFTYNPRLRYIHLVQDRPMSFNTEKRTIDSVVLSYKKKGVSPKSTCNNLIRNYRMRWFIKVLGGNDDKNSISVIKDAIRYCKSVK